jgi:hypothetical protein
VHERPSGTQKIVIMVKMVLTVWRFARFRRISGDFLFVFLFGGFDRLNFTSASSRAVSTQAKHPHATGTE